MQSVLDRHVSPEQKIKSDGLPVFNVVKGMGHTHAAEIVYPKGGAPNYDALMGKHIGIEREGIHPRYISRSHEEASAVLSQ